MQKELYRASAGFLKSLSYYTTEVRGAVIVLKLSLSIHQLITCCYICFCTQAIATSIPVLWTISVALMVPVMMVRTLNGANHIVPAVKR